VVLGVVTVLIAAIAACTVLAANRGQFFPPPAATGP
jgi:hypothetical protein